jgi:hypothetical protein
MAPNFCKRHWRPDNYLPLYKPVPDNTVSSQYQHKFRLHYYKTLDSQLRFFLDIKKFLIFINSFIDHLPYAKNPMKTNAKKAFIIIIIELKIQKFLQ